MRNSFLTVLYITFFLTLVVIVLGAYTRLSDAGLGCPDWPGCYGNLTVPDTVDSNQYQRPLEKDKAWKEMVHRYSAGSLGLVILLIFLMGLFLPKTSHVSTRPGGKRNILLPTLLLGTVIFQALLGMLTVTELLSPTIVSAHLLGGFTTLAITWWLIIREHKAATPPSSTPLFINAGFWRIAAFIGLILVILQIFLGGWTSTNYAALACGSTFPACQGTWSPTLDFTHAFNLNWEENVNYEFGTLDSASRAAIHVTHRIGAFVVLIYIGLLSLALIRKKLSSAAKWALILLLAQFTLGMLNVFTSLNIGIAVAHNLVAALLLLSVISINFNLYHLNQSYR